MAPNAATTAARIAALFAAAVGALVILARAPFASSVVPIVLSLCLSIGVISIPPGRRAWRRIIAALENLRGKRAVAASAIFGVLGGVYLIATALYQGRSLFPKWHDEFMYLLQARLLASGRLWMPPHPLGEFFDTFYVFAKPVYAPLSWPGTALLFAPGVALDLPKWVIPLLCAGAVVGVYFWLFTKLLDGFSAALGALLLVSLSTFRQQSLAAQAQVPTLLLGGLMLIAWLRWTSTGKHRWLVLLGAASGWAAITRPIDALCIAMPIGLAMLHPILMAPRLLIPRLVILLASAAPFLALQLYFNAGVTGDVLKPPFTYYNDLDYPQVAFGLPRFDPNAHPVSTLLQKQVIYSEWIVPQVRQHQPENFLSNWLRYRVPLTFLACVPSAALLLLAPFGLFSLRDGRRIVFVAVLPLFLVLYAFYTIFAPHYAVLCAPAVTFLVVAGAKRLGPGLLDGGWGNAAGFRETVRLGAALFVASLAIFSLPEFRPGLRDEPTPMPATEASSMLPRVVSAPALVFFRFRHGDYVHDEPVYNIDTAWPDDAPIIRAHDLGDDKNKQLIAYYAKLNPARDVYLYDRKMRSLTYLGQAGALAGAGR